jgi:radical SAM protein
MSQFLLECRGRVEPGRRLGHLLGAPTANLRVADGTGLGFGTFAAIVEGLDRPHRAVAHLGVRPSVADDGGAVLLEAHLLDFDGDLYGRELTVKLAHKVADEARLDSLEALARKIAADVAAVRAYFGEASAPPVHARGAVRRRPGGGGFDDTPFMVFWETTQACDLVCKHCRADARPARDAEELGFDEGCRLLDDVRAMGCPLVVLTGGDPAKRPDLVDLVRHGSRTGLRVALTPSATPLVTRALLERLADAGLARLAVSLDGAGPASHDGFRGVAGSFARTLEILRDARAVGLTTQVNTTVTDLSMGELERVAALLAGFEITLWGVFFLVPTGRGAGLHVLEPQVVEQVLARLAAIARTAPFDVKTTAAPHFRRVLLQQQMTRREIVGIDDGIGRARGVNDGQGIVFVSHRGEIFPSGFLPVPCGSVRTEGLASVYRLHPVFRALRDPDALGGKCGVCEFRRVCGGSRARAYAMTGDMLAEEPACAYVPPAVRRAS